MKFAEVAVDAPSGYDRTFSYSIPKSLGVRPGHLVQVPFGSRTLQGVVFSLAEVPQVPQTRAILAVTGHEPLLTETQIALSRWISRYYMAPLFEAAALMLPPGTRARPRLHLSPGTEAGAVDETALRPLDCRVLDYVRNRGKVEVERLVQTLGARTRPAVARLVDKRLLVRSLGRRRIIGPKYLHYATLTDDVRQSASEWVTGAARRAPRQADLVARLLEDDAPLLLSDARKEYGVSAVRALLARGWLQDDRVAVERDPLAGLEVPPSPEAVLTASQAESADEIGAALADPSAVPRALLIHGVTGSGKTEVYLDAVRRCLGLGKRAIMLVPEIALTHQTVERFASRFPGQVAVLHSGLSAGERFDQWWKIRQGHYGVVVGSRSALFSPQPDLVLVVIDEEHEWTYKAHDASPRYHAREVALKLAELTGAVVVMGSASPDVGTYYRARGGHFRLLTLPHRVSVDGEGPLPLVRPAALASVAVVDMRKELREGNRGIFSRALSSAMGECLSDGGQMILFLNRRGSASYVQCRNCGFNLRCRRCDVALTYHRSVGRFVCHYCGYRRLAPAKCPRCLSYRLSYYGVGTEAVVEEVAALFPDVTVLRWDRDAAKSPRAYEGLLSRFRSGQAQVLVGTQMIAKGLHFPSVTLVGVVSADTGLNIPDYRSGERTFQLLCQVAGRAGRGPRAGRVIVQTYQPDNYAVRAAATQDYPGFFVQEVAFRGEQGDPPFGRLIRLLYTHTNLALCEREASRMARLLRGEREAGGHSEIDLLGPTPAYPVRLRGRYRWHLVLRGPEPRALLERVAIPQGWVVDVDPVALT